MRLVAWNMGAAYGPFVAWHDRAWHWLAALDADVALLQETVPPDWAAERWTIHTLPHTHWASAIAVRPGLDFEPLVPAPDTILGRCGAYLATGELRRTDGRSLLLGSVHARAAVAPEWVTAGADRAATARPSVGEPWSNDVVFGAYRDLAGADRPFVIGGDWNTARYLDGAGVGDPQGIEFFDRAAGAGWLELSLDAAGREGRSWYGSDNPRPYQNDQAFGDAQTAAGCARFAIDADPAAMLHLSDHAPLVFELDVLGWPVEVPGDAHG